MKLFLKSRIQGALESKDKKALDALLTNENINMRIDDDNGTALHYLARKGIEGIVPHLAERGIAVDTVDDYNWTALHHAVHRGRFNLVVELLRAGADPNLRTVEGRNAYGWASLREHSEISELLKPYMKKMANLVDLPLPEEGAPQEEKRQAEWKKLSGEKIARVAVEQEIGYQITEIFNFAAQERTTLYHNLETGSESAETRSFASMEGRQELEQALAELQKRGGTADSSCIGALAKKRIAP